MFICHSSTHSFPLLRKQFLTKQRIRLLLFMTYTISDKNSSLDDDDLICPSVFKCKLLQKVGDLVLKLWIWLCCYKLLVY